MGIKGLAKLLADQAPQSFKECKFESFFGRIIAVDASMHIYQFLAVVGRTGDQLLTSEAGDVTSHLQGMFFRTARMLEAGMKPVFVFDGKPPQAKSDELKRRGEKRGEADLALEKAKESGNQEEIEKYSKRTTRVTMQHNEECKRLLTLMGVPIINAGKQDSLRLLQAPSEAEAQCAEMCKEGLVWGISTEDMDALTFGTPRLIRNLMAAVAQKLPINVYEVDKRGGDGTNVAQVLEGLQLTRDQFIDVCILSGCDYCGTIRGVAANSAFKLVQKHGTLKAALENLDSKKYLIPNPFPYEMAQQLFKEPVVAKKEDLPALKWSAADEDGLIKFLVEEKSFNESRVRGVVKKINADRSKANQGRLESFFGPSSVKSSTIGVKRKDADTKTKGAAKNKKAASSKK